MLSFEWDETKNISNFKKHEISFEIAQGIFDNPTIDIIDNRFNYQETRIKTIGRLENEIILVVIRTDRNGVIRLISARKARKDEREYYYKILNQRGTE
jgi:uncharacterized DUF497 family protein